MQTKIHVDIFDKVHRLEESGDAHATADENGVELHFPIQINACISHEDIQKLAELKPKTTNADPLNVKVYGDKARDIAEGDVFVAKVGSIEGRTVVTLVKK
jgi:hypothetical protein